MKTIKQTIVFNTSCDDLYDMLINPRKLSKIIGGKVTNSMKVLGKFSAYDDYIFGENIEIIPGKKIIQKWACQDFPKNQFSDLKIELKKISDKQTELNLTQENVPDDLFEDLSVGWNEFYWDPIKDYLEDLMWK
jgi:activator of HSP90 ATPase